MIHSLVVLALLAALTPAAGIFGSAAASGVVCAIMAVAMIAMAPSLRTSAIEKLKVLLRPVLLGVLFVPFGWMLLQVTPIPALSDPVWATTSSALNLPISGHITIDVGATLLSMVRYSALLATAVTVAASSSDRQSAKRLLYILTGIAAFVAAIQILHGSDLGCSEGDYVGGILISSFGVILSCAMGIRVHGEPSIKRKWGLAASGAALVLCTSSIVQLGDTTVLLAALSGAGIPISIFVIRRWSLSRWGQAGVGVTVLMLFLGFLAIVQIKGDAFPAVALKCDLPTELMLSEVPLFGRGAGSAEDLLPVYRDLNHGSTQQGPGAVSLIIVEMGRIFLGLFILALAAGVMMLLRSSLNRIRDYVYAASGAGILVAVVIAMFITIDPLSLPSSLLATTALGLAWAQSRSAQETILPAAESAAIAISPRPPRPPYLDRPGIRLAVTLLGLVLATEAAWVLLPELYASGGLLRLTRAANRLENTKNLENAASIARLRGDLWAKSAIRSAMLLEENPNINLAPDHVRDILVRALRYSPYQGEVWLTLARLADHYKWPGYDRAALLKMVYYTAANDINSMSRRTMLALRVDATALDVELQDMIVRDITLILRQLPELRPGLLEAYKAANPSGKALAERTIAGIDPDFLKTAQSR